MPLHGETEATATKGHEADLSRSWDPEGQKFPRKDTTSYSYRGLLMAPNARSSQQRPTHGQQGHHRVGVEGGSRGLIRDPLELRVMVTSYLDEMIPWGALITSNHPSSKHPHRSTPIQSPTFVHTVLVTYCLGPPLARGCQVLGAHIVLNKCLVKE